MTVFFKVEAGLTAVLYWIISRETMMNRRDVKDADPRSSTFTEWPTPPLTRPEATGELKPGVKLQNEKKLAQNTNLFFSLYHSTAGTPAAVPKLSSAQISEHYSTCIKLSTENVSWYLRMLYFTFTFSHLADAYIQSDLQLGVHKAINLELLDFLLETLLLCVQLKRNSTITCCLFFFTENYHKECIWSTPHWLHGRHS